MTRLEALFQQPRKQFIAYICALDPDYATSLEICKLLIESGVDVLELGVPFSDPLADGKTNQLAAERALANGATTDQVFELVADIRKFSEVPIVFYTYYNIVYNQGIDNYCQKAKQAGVDAMLVLDLPPEEAGEMVEACKRYDIDRIFLVTPRTLENRIPRITENASGFIYYVSFEGVTGERTQVAADLQERVNAIRKYTPLPVCCGFGISNADQVNQVAEIADGVIVGSSIVRLIAENEGDNPVILNAIKEKVSSLISGIPA